MNLVRPLHHARVHAVRVGAAASRVIVRRIELASNIADDTASCASTRRLIGENDHRQRQNQLKSPLKQMVVHAATRVLGGQHALTSSSAGTLPYSPPTT